MTDISELTPLQAAERLAALSPETTARLGRFLEAGWSDDEPGFSAFREIGAAIASKRQPISSKDLKSLFDFVERLLVQGSGDVPNMVATCMLETIWRASRDSGFDFAAVDAYLGREARRYLLAWDAFNKTDTTGLTRG